MQFTKFFAPMRVASLILLSGLIAIPATAQPFGETRRYFTDWLAACRPATQYCSATAYVNPIGDEGDGVPDYVLRVGRHIASDAQWEISFTVVEKTLDINQPLEAKVNRLTPKIFRPKTAYNAYGSINDFFLTGPQAQPLFDQMIAGDLVEFSFTDTNVQPAKALFSLVGLSAALLWMDERQGKIGSPRTTGNAPLAEKKVVSATSPVTSSTTNRPTAKKDPTRTNGFPNRLLAQHHGEATNCDNFSDKTVRLNQGQIAPLTFGSTLYILPCFTAAYNAGFRLYIGDSGNEGFFRTQYLATLSQNGAWTANDILMGAQFETDSKTLSTFYKARGAGGCGYAAKYRWNDWQFELIEYRDKPECDDTDDLFPIVYTAPALKD